MPGCWPQVAVVIPALNEAESVAGVLADLPRLGRVIVVDNGSTDATAAVAASCGADVVLEPRRGYGSAVQAGIAALAADPPEVLVILDADHADRPELLGQLVLPILDDEADLVLSERSRTADPGALTLTQRLGNGLAVRLMAASTGHRYRDMGPFRAIRWESLRLLRMEDPTWGWNVEMQMKAVHHGLRILEIPTPYRRRERGRSKISGSLVGAVRAGARILTSVHRYRRR